MRCIRSQVDKCHILLFTAATMLLLFGNYILSPHKPRRLPYNDALDGVGDARAITNGNGNCQRRENVYYLKIHKTGSSTITTLLFRFLFRHDLKVVPVKWQIYPSFRIQPYIERHNRNTNDNESYNIFLEHSIFDENEVNKVLPKDTVKIATIRQPLSQLKSSFNEFQLARFLNISKDGDPVLHFLEDPKIMGSITFIEEKSIRYLLRNTMSLEFGLPEGQQAKTTEVRAYLEYINKRFDLVLVAEAMPESLVLLRRRMCWEMRDIVYIHQRVKTYPYKNVTYPKEILRQHEESNMADYTLYRYFLSKHKKLIEQEDGIREEVACLKRINSEVTEFCDKVYLSVRSQPHGGFQSAQSRFHSLALDPGEWGKPFTLDVIDCALMKLDTVRLRQIALARQLPELCQDFVVSGYFNEDFCSTLGGKYDLPLKVFDHRDYYMLS